MTSPGDDAHEPLTPEPGSGTGTSGSPEFSTSGSLGLPPLPPPIGPILPRPVVRRRGRWALLAVALIVLAGIVVIIVANSSGDRSLPLPPGMTAPGGAGAADPTRTATSQLSGAPPGAGAGSPGSGPAAPSVGASPTPTAAPGVPLRARYSSVPNGLLGLGGYTGTVTITNPGPGAVTGWKVIITLPGAAYKGASGANAQQSDATLTFTPTDETRTVPPSGTASFSFDVSGLLAAQPTGCAIDGRPCD